MSSPRQASVNLTYIPKGAATAITAPTLAQYMESFEYVDAASGESDTVSAKFSNINMQWLNTWLPTIGDKMEAQIVTESWSSEGDYNVFDCGKFCVDDLKYSGPNLTCTLGGVSVPESQDFHCTARSYTWQMVTLQEMATAIGAQYFMPVYYDAPDIYIESIEQDSQTDSEFLTKVCEDYGLAVKIYFGKIVIYDLDTYEAKPAVATYDIQDFQSWDAQSTLTGTYTGATITYTNETDNSEIQLAVGTPGRLLNVNTEAANEADALLKACAMVNDENRNAVTMTATIKANLSVVAGSCIEIVGAFDLNGKYFVDKATHNIDGTSAYTMNLELHKVQEKITAQAPDPMALFAAALVALLGGGA